jgi:predicted nucleic acid-binding protein
MSDEAGRQRVVIEGVPRGGRLDRRFAERLELPLTGTLGLLLSAKEAGLYLRADLVKRVLELAGELPA